MKRRLPEIAVVLVATLLRLAYFAQFRVTPYYDHPLVDAHVYDEKAWRIAGGDWLGDASVADTAWVTSPVETWQRWHEAGADGAIVLARSTADVDALVDAAQRW